MPGGHKFALTPLALIVASLGLSGCNSDNLEDKAKELNSSVICPVNDAFLGQICSIPIETPDPLELKKTLYYTHNIEIPVVSFSGDIYLRISFQAYNGVQEIETLIDALRKIKKNTGLLP